MKFRCCLLPHWIRVLASSVSIAIVVGCGGSADAFQTVFPSALREVNGERSFVFLSDTQSPLWFEKIWLKADDNESATQQILASIAHDSTVVALFHLGDF
ncbi:MAG: hypothetical protein AAB393_06280, partial [Bacteroidota bacterium]